MDIFGQAADPDGRPSDPVRELLDRDHHRASVGDGQRMLIEPGKVLDNIEMAMRRLDLDIDTPISIEDDVVALSELAGMVDTLHLGRTLAVTVVNTSMAITAARYPADLVATPLPAGYDLRKIVPFQFSDAHHELAKTIFNRRITSPVDLTEKDIAAEFASLAVEEQVQIFVILFYMFGTRLGAIKSRSGIA